MKLFPRILPARSRRSIYVRSVVMPLVLLATLQLSGCTPSGQTTTIPRAPGGIYISHSAGAHFDQAELTDPADLDFAALPLQRGFQPLFDPAKIYVAAGNAGLVVSADAGATWRQVTVPLAFIYDVIVLESGVWVVAGIDTEGQGFVARSGDEGLSWEVALTIPKPTQRSLQFLGGSQQSAAAVVISIALDPFNPDRIYAGTSLGNIFVGEQGAKTWRSEATLNQGSIGANQTDLVITNIVPSVHVPGELLAITQAGALYRVQGTLSERIKITTAAATNLLSPKRAVRNASYVPQFPNALLVGLSDGAALTRDGGATWEELALPVDTTRQFKTVDITVSPTNPARLFVAINNVIYRSEDGGRTWHTFSVGAANHTISAVLINPANSATVITVTTPPQQ